MIRPGVHGDAGLVPVAGLIRSLSAREGVTHHSLAARFPCIQTGVHRTLRVKLEDQTRCLQMRSTTSSALIRIGISTRLRSWALRRVVLSRSARFGRAAEATRTRFGWRSNTRPAPGSGRLKALGTTVLGSLAS